MISVLQQFYKALVATLTSYKHTVVVKEEEVVSLTEQLQAVTGERDLLLEEQEQALKLIDEMTEELDKQ